MLRQFQSLQWSQIAIMLGALSFIAISLFLIRKASDRQGNEVDGDETK